MRIAAFVLLLSLLVVKVANAAPRSRGEVAAFADEVGAKKVAACRGAPGLAVAIVWPRAERGFEVLARGYGLANVATRAPVDPDRTLFGIASVTKTVTATAAMQLVERGELSLHADVRSRLPFELRGSPALRAEPITLAQLLTHTAGLEETNLGVGVLGPADIRPLQDHLSLHVPVREHRPGEIWSYTNVSYSLVGYLIELASRSSFASYVEANVFGPLGMRRSTFAPSSDDDVAALYEEAGGVLHERPRPFMHDVPAGGLYAAAADIGKLMAAHLDLDPGREGGVIARPETLRAMHTRAYAFHPSLEGMTYGFMEEGAGQSRRLVHEGSMGYTSLLTLLPERGIGLFVTINGEPDASVRSCANIPSDVTGELLAWLDPKEATSGEAKVKAGAMHVVTPAAGALDAKRLEGTYRNTRHASSTLEKMFVLLGLTRELTVRVEDDGALRVGRGRFIEREPWVFDRIDKEGRIAFRESVPGAGADLLSVNLETYRRVSWDDSRMLHRALVAVAALVFLGTLLGSPARALLRVVRRRHAARRDTPRVTWLARVVSLLAIVFVAGMVAPFFGVHGPYWIFFGIPPIVRVVLLVPYVMMAVMLPLPVLVAKAAWERRFACAAHGAFVVVGASAFLWVLDRYNMIGVHA